MGEEGPINTVDLSFMNLTRENQAPWENVSVNQTCVGLAVIS